MRTTVALRSVISIASPLQKVPRDRVGPRAAEDPFASVEHVEIGVKPERVLRRGQARHRSDLRRPGPPREFDDPFHLGAGRQGIAVFYGVAKDLDAVRKNSRLVEPDGALVAHNRNGDGAVGLAGG